MWTFGRNLLLIKFGSERVKETKWTGLSARIRALFLKKLWLQYLISDLKSTLSIIPGMIHGRTAKKRDNNLTWPHSVSSAKWQLGEGGMGGGGVNTSD